MNGKVCWIIDELMMGEEFLIYEYSLMLIKFIFIPLTFSIHSKNKVFQESPINLFKQYEFEHNSK